MSEPLWITPGSTPGSTPVATEAEPALDATGSIHISPVHSPEARPEAPGSTPAVHCFRFPSLFRGKRKLDRPFIAHNDTELARLGITRHTRKDAAA